MKADFYRLIDQSEERYKKIQPEILEVQKKIAAKVPLEEINTELELTESLNRDKQRNPTLDVHERIIGSSDILPINYVRIATIRARSVARVVVKNKLGGVEKYGSGFMISPYLFMTNNHVIESKVVARRSQIEFDYETTIFGKPNKVKRFNTLPDQFFITSHKDELDYTVVKLADVAEDNEPLSQFGCIPLIEETGKILVGDSMSIIQHPNGEPKQITIRDNILLKKLKDRLIYKTDTMGGSSGAPVFNDIWEVVALHHSGVPEKDEDGDILSIDGRKWKEWMGEHKVKWIGNEGIRISQILKDIGKRNIETAFKPLRDQIFNVADTALELELKNETVKADGVTTKTSQAREQTFEILFSPSQGLKQLAIDQLKKLYKAKIDPLFFDLSNDPKNDELRRFCRVILFSDQDPWDIGRELKKIEGVQDVDPILETRGMEDPDQEMSAFESIGGKEVKSNKASKEKKFKELTPDWSHHNTRFYEAVGSSKKAGKLKRKTRLKVAQIDTGYTDHPEIHLMQKLKGFDYLNIDSNPQDELVSGFMKQPGHGTRTGSVFIGAQTNLPTDHKNGVFPFVDFVPFRVANSVIILGTAANVTNAVATAVKDNFDVITMSMGSYGRSSWKALAKYVYDHGVIWCCAAGNEVRKFFMVVRPAKYKGTIAVAATNYKDKPWSKSSRGEAVDIAAPGQDVYVPIQYSDKSYGYNYGSGTSYATPHIAAAACLWLNHHRRDISTKYKEPWQRVEAFRTLMKKTARKPAGWKKGMGAGILDAQALLKAKLPDAKSLVYAYGSSAIGTFESLEMAPDITEKELIHYLWNQENSNNLGFEATGKKLSKEASRLYSVLQKDPKKILLGLNHKY